MDPVRVKAFPKTGLSLLACAVVVFSGLVILGQGCSDVDKLVMETQREHKLKQQMRWAEDELRKGNLVSAQTVFDWVCRESTRPSIRERALFFSGFSTLLDEREAGRWERGREIFARVNEEFAEGEFGQISSYVAAALSGVVSDIEALERDIVSMGHRVDLERSHNQEMDELVKRQKKELSEKAEEVTKLKDVILQKNREIESLKMQIKKVEEIHKEIKEKRKGLS
jgi:hypothetical protein